MPCDTTENSPYVLSKGTYQHIVENWGREEAMISTLEHPDGRQGFGFFLVQAHDKQENDSFRKVILNECP